MFTRWGLLKRKRYSQKEQPAKSIQKRDQTTESDPLHTELDQNLERVNCLFPASPDLIIYRLVSGPQHTPFALLYLEGLTDKNALNNNILYPLLHDQSQGGIPLPSTSHVQEVSDWVEIQKLILEGNSVLLMEGRDQAWVCDTRGWPQRALEDPQLESSLKGAHQGFVETGAQNIALIRRYLPTPELRIVEHIVGRRGQSKVWIVYLEDIAHPEVLAEMESRIQKINVDAVINTGELAEYIEDNPFSPFPQFILTERPDSTVSQILQGRIAVVVDRSPSVIIAPASLISFLQSVDDYSIRWMTASFLRLLRVLAFLITIHLPAIYIALVSFQHEIIPIQLFLSVAESREMVPFPPILEALAMEIMLEMMREAGVRLPAPVGQTIGIVGGIIVGQAAVQAGIVSNIMVIVVASTAIASFILPNYDMGTAIRLIRFPMMILASLFGLIGIVIGSMTLLAHLVSLESLGTPYGSPLAPLRWSDMKDTFVRLPLWMMNKRPKSTRAIQDIRKEDTRPEGDSS